MLVHNLPFYSVVFASPKMLFVEITICRATAQDVTDSSKNTGGFSPVPRQVEIPFDTPDKKTASCTKESDTPVTGS